MWQLRLREVEGLVPRYQLGLAELGFNPECLLDPRAWELPWETLLLPKLEEPDGAFY